MIETSDSEAPIRNYVLLTQLAVGAVTVLLGRELFHVFIMRLVRKWLSQAQIFRGLLSFITFPMV